MKRILIHFSAKLFIIILFLFICIHDAVDIFSTSNISDYYDVQLNVHSLKGKFRLLPKSINDLYLYQSSSGNRWWTPIEVADDTITLSNIYYESLVLSVEDNGAPTYYNIVHVGNSEYKLDQKHTATHNLKYYIGYQIIKSSLLLFLTLCLLLIGIDLILKKSFKVYFYSNVIVSITFSAFLIYFYFFFYFYQYLFQ